MKEMIEQLELFEQQVQETHNAPMWIKARLNGLVKQFKATPLCGCTKFFEDRNKEGFFRCGCGMEYSVQEVQEFLDNTRAVNQQN